MIWNSIIVQSDCSPRELSAKSIGIAFPKKVPERARSNFITKEHSKVITFIITFLNCLKSSHFSLLPQSHFHYHKQGKTQTNNIWILETERRTTYHHFNTAHGVDGNHDAQGRQSSWVWQSWQSCDNHDNHDNHDQGRQSPWVWQCTSFQSPSCQKSRWSVVCLCFQLVQPSLVFLQPTSCFMFMSALAIIQNHRCLFTLNCTVDSYICGK